MKQIKKYLAWVLVFTILVGVLPLGSLAASITEPESVVSEPISPSSSEVEGTPQPEEVSGAETSPTPMATPTPEQTAAPTPEPTEAPSPEATLEPTETPAPGTTLEPTPEPTPVPTIAPIPTVKPEEISLEKENTAVNDVFTSNSKARATGKNGTLYIRYNSMINGVTTGSFGSTSQTPAKEMSINGSRVPAYCLNKDKAAEGDIGYDSIDNIPGSVMTTMRIIAANGYRSGSLDGGNYSGGTAKWLVTQLLMWTAEKGNIVRHSDANWTWPASVDRDFEMVAANAYNPSVVRSYYDEVKKKCLNGHKIPSFSADSPSGTSVINLDYNANTGKWSKTITDSNSVLDTFAFQFANSALSVSRSGNKLTVTSTTALGTTNSKVANVKTGNGDSVITWRSEYGNSYFQDLVTGGSDDTVSAYIRVKAEKVLFNATLTKTSANTAVTNGNGNYSLSGAVYEVLNSSGKKVATFTTNAQGKATLSTKLPKGSYTVKETVPPKGYTLDKTVYTLNLSSADGTLSVKDQPSTVTLNLQKKDSVSKTAVPQGNASLAGAEYKATYQYNGASKSVTGVSDKNGKITFKGIPLGQIKVQETKAPTGYKLDPKVYTYTVTADSSAKAVYTLSVDMLEAVIKNKVKVVKTAEISGGKTAPETGAKFEIFLSSAGSYAAAKNSEKQTVTTGKDGTATTKDLPYGIYKVRQLTGSKGRDLAASVTVNINKDIDSQSSPFTVNLVNPLQKGNVTITKTFSDGRTPSGINFLLTGTCTAGFSVSQTATTNTQGKATFSGIPVGTYTISESNCPAGYIKPADQKVTIIKGGTASLSFKNVPQTGNVAVIKTSTDGLNIQGRTFSLKGTSTNGKAISLTATTDTAGKASFTDVLVGKYILSETNCPTAYDKPADQQVTVTHGATATKSFTNVAQTGTVNVTKTSTDGKYLSGIKFSLVGTSTGGKAVNLTATTDSSGKASFGKVLVGTYTVAELNCPVRYTKPADQRVTVAKDSVVEVKFFNKLKEAQVKLVKKCSFYNGYLSGAVFKLFKADGTDTGITLTSDASKWVYSPKVTIGDYYLLEQKAPEHYKMNPKRYDFTLDETHEAAGLAITAYNTPLSDVYPEFVTPNSEYRSDTEVIVSYKIHNDSIAEHNPDRPLKVRLTAISKDAKGNKTQMLDTVSDVIVPYFAQNLVYWKVKIPKDSVGLKLVCTVETPDGVVEVDEGNNTDTQERKVQLWKKSETPDTKFENTPANFRKPPASTTVPNTPAVPNAKWQIYEWVNGQFQLNTYGIRLQADTTIKPDAAVFSAKQANEIWTVKSGYGLSVNTISQMKADGGFLYPDSAAWILPQHGNLYFPEFAYSEAGGKYRTMELTAADKLELPQNPNSITEDGVKDNRRSHFTPLWYPDGDYMVKSYDYDAWTPAGMLSCAANLPTVKIDGDMYQDWYVNHTAQKDK